MTAHEIPSGLGGQRFQRLHHTAFHAANIRKDDARFQCRLHLRYQRLHLGQRRAQDDQIRAINGREFLVFDLDVELPDGPNHNLLAITSLEGRMLIVSYNCMPARHANCVDLGNRLVGSIQVKGK